jgi:ribosomal-protein-alanine N-acetyltransferase
MTPELETTRLILKPLQLADAEQVQKLFSQWEVVRYLNAAVPWPYPADGALTYIRDNALPAIRRGELWYWTIRLKSAPGQIIGAITLSVKDQENRGFWLAPKWQRQGLMTEACHAATDYWFEVLGRPVLRAPKAIANEASRRISVKQGMRIVSREDKDYVCGRMPSETWEITLEEWRARNRTNLRPLRQQQNAQNS